MLMIITKEWWQQKIKCDQMFTATVSPLSMRNMHSLVFMYLNAMLVTVLCNDGTKGQNLFCFSI